MKSQHYLDAFDRQDRQVVDGQLRCKTGTPCGKRCLPRGQKCRDLMQNTKSNAKNAAIAVGGTLLAGGAIAAGIAAQKLAREKNENQRNQKQRDLEAKKAETNRKFNEKFAAKQRKSGEPLGANGRPMKSAAPKD